MPKEQISEFQQKFSQFYEDFALFVEGAFIAVKQYNEKGARQIFQAAQALNPESSAPKIGFGYIALNKMEIKEATSIFEEVLKKEPDNALAQTFLGIALIMGKEQADVSRGEKLVRNALEKTKDPTVQNLASIILEWKDKAKKNDKAPFFDTSSSKE